VCLLGVRSFEPEEEERLRRLGVRVILMQEIERRGIDAAFDEALAIATAGTAAFGISVDLDVVTPDEAPGVATPVQGGIGGAALARALERIGGRTDLAAVELVEYCPKLDPRGASARIAVDILDAALCGPRQDAKVLAEALHR
jgi:arginase